MVPIRRIAHPSPSSSRLPADAALTMAQVPTDIQLQAGAIGIAYRAQQLADVARLLASGLTLAAPYGWAVLAVQNALVESALVNARVLAWFFATDVSVESFVEVAAKGVCRHLRVLWPKEVPATDVGLVDACGGDEGASRDSEVEPVVVGCREVALAFAGDQVELRCVGGIDESVLAERNDLRRHRDDALLSEIREPPIDDGLEREGAGGDPLRDDRRDPSRATARR